MLWRRGHDLPRVVLLVLVLPPPSLGAKAGASAGRLAQECGLLPSGPMMGAAPGRPHDGVRCRARVPGGSGQSAASWRAAS